MTAPVSPGVYVALAFAVLCVNLFWLGIFGPRLTKRYLVGLRPLTLIWATTLIGATVIYFGSLSSPSVTLPAGTAMFTLGWISMLSDFRSRRLPNALTLLMAVEVVLALALISLLQPFNLQTWMNALLGALLWSALIGLGWRLGQMGLGDLKLAPVLGFILGCSSWVDAGLALVLAFLTSGLYGLFTRLRGGHRLRIPFGPSMLGAAMSIWGIRILLGPGPLLSLTT